MVYVLEPEQMQAADAAALAGQDALMRNAGARIAERVRAMCAPGSRIVAFAGPGNNGGDAFAAFAELGNAYECIAYAHALARPSAARDAAQARAREAGATVRDLPAGEAAARDALRGATGIDALFGTGARLPISPEYRHLSRALDARELPVLAIDVPTGIDALTGAADDDAVRASVTVTLGALKPGLLLDPARAFVGELWCARIGIDDADLAAHAGTFAALDDDAFLRLLPVRSPTADKRSAGAPLVIAGSRQFPGAAVLCARAAARAGAGYVTVAAPASAAAALRAHLLEQVVIELSDDAPPETVVEDLLDVSRRNGAVAIGPGLGLDERTGVIVRAFLERTNLPAVIDAGALFHLAKHLDILRGKPCVLTPHAGEFARLSGQGTVDEPQRVTRLREFTERTAVPTLLKGRATLVCGGAIVHVNTTGTPALATAGTGDVLTGIIATLLAQGLSPIDAACAGAYWHGLAGQAAARERPVGVVAGDAIEALARALRRPCDPGSAFAAGGSRESWRLF